MSQETEKLKKLLENYRFLIMWANNCNNRIYILEAELNDEMGDIQSANGTDNTGRSVGTYSDKTMKGAQRKLWYDEQIAEIESERLEYMKQRAYIQNLVSCLDYEESRIIKLYYFGNKTTWKNVAKKVYLSRTHVMRKHDYALISMVQKGQNVTK